MLKYLAKDYLIEVSNILESEEAKMVIKMNIGNIWRWSGLGRGIVVSMAAINKMT